MLQAKKSERTHQQFLNSARTLFLKKGFDNTSIEDIVTMAGYSIGAFYRHYKSKSDILIELWNEFLQDYIQESIDGAMKTTTLEESIDYLLLRNKEYYEHPMFKCYYNASVTRMITSSKNDIPNNAGSFNDMLVMLLEREYPSVDHDRLRTYASTIHAIINAYASGSILNQNLYFDEVTTREILLDLAHKAGIE